MDNATRLSYLSSWLNAEALFLSDNFSDHPVSLQEHKADKENSAAAWKPRDALIHVLRLIDNGKINPDSLVIMHTKRDPNDVEKGWTIASAGRYDTLATIELVKEAMQIQFMKDAGHI